MKAVVFNQYGSPDVLQLKEVTKPTPKDKEVLVRVKATTVTSGDTVARKGEPFIARFFTGLLPNLTPGSELAGEIEAVGNDVTTFQTGDQVFASTGMSLGANVEYRCLPEDGEIAIMPANMSYEEASAVPFGATTALYFIRDKARIEPGQHILVNGASGSVGTYAVQLAKYYGATVTAVCSTRNVELVQSLGADEVIDYTQADFTQNTETYDIIFDAVGKSSFSQSKPALKRGGIFVSIAMTPALIWQSLWTSIVGSKKATWGILMKSQQDDYVFLKALIEMGQLKSVIDRCYALEDIAEAHRYVDTGRKRGNVVIRVAT